ncbi:sterile alpha motif domain-containing protein 9-like isoform X2 [Colossoma macropomum]|nr:sterile alpha motif domain-containing protein 9-like isoform X2 [Colossoma macropomum]XP_036426902.1 sterile alpha motif domain-containing protein 9-like isoform X2 [Colossoma macropomum]
MSDYKHHPIEKWTKEHVQAWLCKTVQVKQKYADMFVKQEISGECLLCFEKQDIVDMGIEYGPAVKIWSQLKKQKALSNTAASCKQKKQRQTSSTPEADASTKTVSPPQRHPIQRAERDNQMPSIFTLLLHCLEDLTDEDFKKFRRYLKEPILNECNTIPTCQLENKERTNIADLIIEYHGEENALKITVCILKKLPRNDLVESLTKNVDQLQVSTTDSKREVKRETNQGEKLKNLLTCGASTLGHYSHFIIIMNKSDPDQLEHLQFLCKLNLFCVLDFDPSSNTNGTCKLYRESRHANLHFPDLFQGEPSAVIKNLNLYNQTSWVFCNGRLDVNSESNRHLDYQSWLRITHREIEQMVSFIYRPEVLPGRRCLVIFLLLSTVQSEKDPIFDTFMTFHRQCGGEENIIHICKNEHTFEKWQNLIQKKYEFDLNKQSIYELDLSQVNGLIMKLGPHSQPCEKLLPSAGSSYVILQQKDADRMTTLDILCANECDNVQVENSSEFQNLKLEVEEEFYRGGEVKWLNFYFSEKQKAKPFIKRDKYEAVMTMVTSQIKRPKSTCVLVNLFHHPGCGGTTLAKHVMWDLRNQLRCAVLKDSSSDDQVASQIMDLMKHGKSDEPPQTPVLLLVDDSKDTEAAEKLKNCIRRKLDENCVTKHEKCTSSLVIILNCVRTHFPKDQYKCCETQSQYITAELTKKEQDDFEEKLQELRENHKRPENFYSFMIMKSNFDKRYVKNVVCNILKDLDIDTKQAQLLSIMALLNSYIPDSHISQSVCEDFLGMKPLLWGKETVLERMEPYSNLLIGSKGGQYGEYSAIRILHHDIACACLEELDLTYNIKRSDITMDLLHCDLFFKTGLGKDALILSIQRMLIERQRNVKNERDTQFSLLIEKIHKDEGRQKVQDIFMKASSRYETSASIPQALARYLYLYDRDFSQALDWAENATKITENPFTVDTIGQIHKNHLKYKIQQEKEQEMPHTPEYLDAYLELAKKAINAFQRAQKLAKTEYEPYEDYHLAKDSYNQSADMGVIETALIVFEMISSLPFFEGEDPLTKRYLQSFLKGSIPITNVYFEDNVINLKYVDVLKKHEQFVHGLKKQAKTSFEFLDSYFTYLKSRKFEEELDHRCRRKVSEYFKEYISVFCSEAEWSQEQAGKRFLRENMDNEARQMFLEEQKADTFAGLLQHLEKESAETMEKITECYTFLHQRLKSRNPKFKTNFILSNLILHFIKPKSKCTMREQDLIHLLKEMMQEIGLQYSSPEPYYLALLLLWPCSSTPDIDKNILLYVRAIRSSFHRQLPHSLRRRGAISYFLLGNKSGLEKLVPKAKLYDSKDPKESNRLWQSGEIFTLEDIKDRLHRVYGTVEQGEVYFEHTKHKIPVHPALLGAVRTGFSTERVSFYLGFSMTGPLAYDIRYES